AVLTRCVESSASLLFFLFGHAISVIGPLSLHDALPISAGLVLSGGALVLLFLMPVAGVLVGKFQARYIIGFGWLVLSLGMYYSRSEEHTSELQSRFDLVCRLLLEKKKKVC